MTVPRPPRSVFGRGSWSEATRIADVLRKETVGGALLLLGSVVALVWANSPAAGSYAALRDQVVGPEALHLDLSLGTWAADGLLAVFFFVVGLELKREFVAGDLRDPSRAALPILAAVGGVVVPAGVFVLVNLGTGDGALRGWAIPTATDIAFALAVLAIISTHLPTALRTFLLTLAVVDDLIAVSIIAFAYTETLHLVPLVAALLPLALFALAVQRRVRSWWLLLPLAAATWALVHASGDPRHRRGRPARLHRPGGPLPGRRRSGGRARARRALRAPAAPALRRRRGPGLRVLRRRCGRRWARRARHLAHRPDRAGHRRRAAPRQASGRVRDHLRRGPVHPRHPRREPRLARRARALDAGRHRLHRLAADRRPRLRSGKRPPTSTSRWASSSARSSRPWWPP